MAMPWKAWQWPTNSATYNGDNAGGSKTLPPATGFRALHPKASLHSGSTRQEFDANLEL